MVPYQLWVTLAGALNYSIWQNNQWFQEKQTEVNTSFVLWHSSRWYIVLFTHNMLLFLRSFAAVIELI